MNLSFNLIIQGGVLDDGDIVAEIVGPDTLTQDSFPWMGSFEIRVRNLGSSVANISCNAETTDGPGHKVRVSVMNDQGLIEPGTDYSIKVNCESLEPLIHGDQVSILLSGTVQ